MIRINLLPERSPWAKGNAKDCEHFYLGVLDRTPSGQCRLCTRKAKSKWNESNRDYFRQWREENADELKVKKKAHYDENAPYYRAESRRWNEENPEQKSATNKAWREASPEIKRRAAGIVFLPGQTIKSIRTEQNEQCAICKCDLTELASRNIHVDHDHAVVGQPNVRGVLCCWCNVAIGNLRDDPARCLAAADYLERSR